MLKIVDYIRKHKDSAVPWSKNKTQDNIDWRNEHGQPDFEFLESLVSEGSPESLEKLKSIAHDLDINFNDATSNEELIDKILSDIRSDPTVTS